MFHAHHASGQWDRWLASSRHELSRIYDQQADPVIALL
jgi:hypothetical protein